MNPLTILGIKAMAAMAAIGALLWGIYAIDQSRQQIGYDRRVAEDNADLFKAMAAARAKERDLNQRLETARHDADQRDQEIRRHAAAAADASGRLRIALDTLRRSVPRDPGAPAADATGALAELLGDCADRYRGLAEAADRHASDARALSEAWPM